MELLLLLLLLLRLAMARDDVDCRRVFPSRIGAAFGLCLCCSSSSSSLSGGRSTRLCTRQHHAGVVLAFKHASETLRTRD